MSLLRENHDSHFIFSVVVLYVMHTGLFRSEKVLYVHLHPFQQLCWCHNAYHTLVTMWYHVGTFGVSLECHVVVGPTGSHSCCHVHSQGTSQWAMHFCLARRRPPRVMSQKKLGKETRPHRRWSDWSWVLSIHIFEMLGSWIDPHNKCRDCRKDTGLRCPAIGRGTISCRTAAEHPNIRHTRTRRTLRDQITDLKANFQQLQDDVAWA